MLQYREGNPAKGKKLYLEAISKAKMKSDLDLVFIAMLCFAREEKLQGNSVSEIMNEVSAPKYKEQNRLYHKLIENYNLI